MPVSADMIVQGAMVFLVALCATYAFVPVSKRIARAIGAIDYPGERRVQDHAIPRAGGIALYAGFAAGCATMAIGTHFFGWGMGDLYIEHGVNYPLLLLGVTISFAVGLVDDARQLSPRVKLVGQIVAAVAICMAGITLESIRLPFDKGEFVLGWADIPVTTLYILVFINAINLIDGLDGLAAGIVAIMGVALFYLVFTRGNVTLAMFCLILVAVCLAFLRFNFNPASVFMGDSGALFLGTVVAVIAVSGVARSQGLAVFSVPLVIAAVPVVDTATSIVRRIREGRAIDQADMEHVHHRLLASGMEHKDTVLVLYAFSAMAAVTGCLMRSVSGTARYAIVAVLAVAIGFVVWRMGLFNPVLQHHYDAKPKVHKRKRGGVSAAGSAVAVDGNPATDGTPAAGAAGAAGADGPPAAGAAGVEGTTAADSEHA